MEKNTNGNTSKDSIMYFAMMEGHLLLAALAQRVSLSLIPGQTIKPDLEHHQTLMPEDGILVRVKKK